MVHYITHPPKRMSLQEIFSGGSPVPPALMRLWEERYGVDVIHFWGMTETSPVGTVARPPSALSVKLASATELARDDFRDLMEFRIVDDKDRVVTCTTATKANSRFQEIPSLPPTTTPPRLISAVPPTFSAAVRSMTPSPNSPRTAGCAPAMWAQLPAMATLQSTTEPAI